MRSLIGRFSASLTLACCGALALLAGGCPIIIDPGSGGGTSSTTSGGSAAGGGGNGGTGSGGSDGCPVDEPGFDGSQVCSPGGLHCDYGQECCDGGCYPSYVCDCNGDGTWLCYYTDACLGGCDPGSGFEDSDQDGYTEAQGDCDDCDPRINPGAAEVLPEPDANGQIPEPKDEDCDGLIDAEDPDLQPCDDALALDAEDPMDAAKAIGVCDRDANGAPKFLKSAAWVLADGSAPGPGVDMAKYHLGHGLVNHFGQNDFPLEGKSMLALSSGTARNKEEPGFVSRNFDKGYSSPPPLTFNGESVACPGSPVSAESVQDAAALELTFQAPTNAQSLEFSFNYRTYDFPEYVCTAFDDFFWVNFAQGNVDRNLSFDAAGDAVSVHSTFLGQCDCPPAGPGACPMSGQAQIVFDCQGKDLLDGTDFDGNTNPMPTYSGWTNGGTAWLRTTAPVEPNKPMKIRFVIFDSGVVGQGVGDHNLDSMVTVDRFRWRATAAANETLPVGP